MAKTKRCITAILVILVFSALIACKPAVEDSASLGNATVIKIFSDMSAENPGNKPWIEFAERENNIKMEFESPPTTSYKERLQIMLASGDYLDVVLFKNSTDTEFTDAVKSGIIVPLNNYLQDKKNLEQYTYEYSWDAMKVMRDDKIYGVPRSTLMRTDGFFIRADWLRNVGLPIPEDRTLTLDEFYEILRRFTYNDPDGNGKNDTYGISSYSDPNNGMLVTIEETFNLFGWQKAMDDDYEYMDAKYSRKNDAYKKALEFNAKLFKEKLIDPDAPVISTNVNSQERFKRGVTGVVRAFPGFLDAIETDLKKVIPSAEIVMVTGIKDAKGEMKAPTPYSSGYYNLWAITSANKNVEKTLEFFDWILSEGVWDFSMYGFEGYSYEVVDGKRIFTSDQAMMHSFGRNIMRRNTDIDFYIPNEVDERLTPKIKEAITECINVSVPSLDRGFKPGVASKPEFMDYQKDMVQTTTKILLGELPANAYDKALDDWYKAGGEEYVEEMNNYLKGFE